MLKSTYLVTYFVSLTWYFIPITSKHWVLISPPGSGKGTLSQYMVEKYGYIHIGAGDIYRKRMRNNASVEPAIFLEILKRYMVTAIQNNQKIILDNAIASQAQFRFWKSFFQMHNITNDVCFIVLQASDQTCMNRIKQRLVCTKCFNVCKKLSSKNQHCSQCGNILSKRNEDNDTFVKKRFQYYHQKINPVIKEIEESFQVIKISSEQSLETLYSIYDELHNL